MVVCLQLVQAVPLPLPMSSLRRTGGYSEWLDDTLKFCLLNNKNCDIKSLLLNHL